MDSELFELCKEVYEKTGWESDTYWETYVGLGGLETRTSPSRRYSTAEYVPLYTSDYLLEKLPNTTTVTKSSIGYTADCDSGDMYFGDSKTPLKSLLNLVIALDDAGVSL